MIVEKILMNKQINTKFYSIRESFKSAKYSTLFVYVDEVCIFWTHMKVIYFFILYRYSFNLFIFTTQDTEFNDSDIIPTFMFLIIQQIDINNVMENVTSAIKEASLMYHREFFHEKTVISIRIR